MDSKLENEYVRQTLNSQGWEIIEGWIKDKITDIRLARNVKKDKPYKDIAIEVLSKARAANKLYSLLKKLDRIKNQTEVKPQSYK